MRSRAAVKRILILGIYSAILANIVWRADHADLRAVGEWVKSFPGGDKLGHFCLVGGFAFVLNWTLHCHEFWFAKRPWLTGSVFLVVLFTVDEFTQFWRPARTFDLLDLAANYAGIFCFGALARRVEAREQARRPRS